MLENSLRNQKTMGKFCNLFFFEKKIKKKIFII